MPNERQGPNQVLAAVRIRPAVADDLARLVDVYNHYVADTHVTFDTRTFSVAERRAWFEAFADQGAHRLLVADKDGQCIGYASSHAFRAKPAYASSVETTVYLDPKVVGQGVGSTLYEALLQILKSEPSVHRALAGVALPNPASARLHERLGFQPVGTFREVGFKFGRYHDVRWYQRDVSSPNPSMSGAKVYDTERLVVREFCLEDGEFLLRLLNDPGFRANLGDKGVRTLDDAHDYLRKGPLASYREFEFGLWRVELRDGTLIGMCGVLKRPALQHPDVGYAFLSEYCGQGYAIEAARGSLEFATSKLNLGRIAAIVSPDNKRSIHLLQKLGMSHETMVRLPGEDSSVMLWETALPLPRHEG